MSIIPKDFQDAVVAIGIDNPASKSNDKKWIGSGFLISRKEKELQGKSTYYVVTNKHVLKEIRCVYFRFNDLGYSFVNDYPTDSNDEQGVASYSAHPDKEKNIVAIQIIPQV